MSETLRVADLLGEPELRDARVVAGAAGLERLVLDVGWYDADDPEAVADSLLLCRPEAVTPAYRLDALVRRAHDSGVAGLLVVAQTELPLLATSRLADRLAVPLVWLPRGRPVQVLQELTVRVRAPELAEARVVNRVVRRIHGRHTAPEILGAVADELGVPVSMLTADGRSLVGPEVELPPDIHLDRAIPQRDDGCLVHPVHDPDSPRVTAWLACRLPRPSHGRMNQVASALAVAEPHVRSWLTTQRAQSRHDALVERQTLAEIVAHRDGVSRGVVESAVSLGWQLQHWHVGVHAVPSPGLDDSERERARARWAAELAAQGIAVVACQDDGDRWLAWSSAEAEPPTADARAVLQRVRRAAAAMPRDLGIAVGIGRPHRGPGGLVETLDEARNAALLALSHDYRPVVEHSDELGVARLLATWQESEVTRSFAETALAPLLDPASQGLLATLRAYLECGGSVVETAAATGVHRNTITTRLQQIRDRLGVDLNDPSQRLALQVACRSVRA
ncbi:helix-turn-helix domain-containing protein [Nocardioides nitrophenolicus]|uniref:helix-turn-helix domain-containing protein n=1 Tax=Nocardioides nitrophenolicus TaxID=60489 RepID=UPI00195F4B03|nr:PucR family transcriptional regulator [Nocardioides nitrophenolicus]MBM7520439.1 hypothetical protein [Nocardioides nitrophenolicus]